MAAASQTFDGPASAERPALHPLAANAWAGVMAASLRIDTDRLAEFSRKMALHGIAVEPARFFFDPFYAYRRLALARATDDGRLRTLTVELFERYEALERRRRDISAFNRHH